MRSRLSRRGVSFLAAVLLSPISLAVGQDPNPDPNIITEPSAPPAVVPLDESPAAAAQRANKAREDAIEDRVQSKNRRRMEGPKRVHDADPWKKNPPIWSVRDDSKTTHPYAHPSRPAPGIGHYPGGPTGQFGFPYYYTPMSPDTAYQPMGMGGMPMPPVPPTIGGGMGYAPAYDVGPGMGGGYAAGYGGGVGPGYGGGYAAGYGGGFAGGYGPVAGMGYGYGGGFGQPGGGMAAVPGQLPGNPYLYHFGPGFYRYQEAGHYSFPYYSYRRPWYFPGHPSYNRDTNIPW